MERFHWSLHLGRQWSEWEGYCERCAQTARNTNARERRRRARADLACNACGTVFTPRRADARYCSNACRQDAYRKRKHGGASAT